MTTSNTSTQIPEKLFFRIGEVCELIRVQPHVLRYWETEFPMLAPQKNRAGQRVYRRRDVEMVMRIRDLLYEEKFTIAGAKKRLMEESRSGALRAKSAPVERAEPEPEEEVEEVETQMASQPAEAAVSEATLSPEARLAVRVLKSNLEDLLTMLNTDASISG
jgi:DNA-binding transcriptional MerR regulator